MTDKNNTDNLDLENKTPVSSSPSSSFPIIQPLRPVIDHADAPTHLSGSSSNSDDSELCAHLRNCGKESLKVQSEAIATILEKVAALSERTEANNAMLLTMIKETMAATTFKINVINQRLDKFATIDDVLATIKTSVDLYNRAYSIGQHENEVHASEFSIGSMKARGRAAVLALTVFACSCLFGLAVLVFWRLPEITEIVKILMAN